MSRAAMCGRYTNTTAPHELGERYGVPITSAEGTGRYNVAPTEQVLTVVAKDGERRAELMRWGLVPSWATEIKGPLMINARLETVTGKPAYRRLVPRGERRALQLADGWFEWLKPEKKSPRTQPRQPFYFQLDDGAPFAFAALWTPAKVEGEWLHSCTLLTCDSSSNRTAAAIHDRMPVVLADGDAQQAWLDPSVGAEEALALCGPLPEFRLSARPVNPAVNKVDPETEGPQLLAAPA